MHRRIKTTDFRYKCSKPNCVSTFNTESLLETHLRVHNNEVDYCQYCPYRYVDPAQYRQHLDKHFRIKNHECVFCGMLFTTKTNLNLHASKHEGITYCCLGCNTYETQRKSTVREHLRKKHSDLFDNNINWDTIFERYVKLK